MGGGRIDLLLARYKPPNYFKLVVVELKRDKIDKGAVLQLMTYMGAIRDAYRSGGDRSILLEDGVKATIEGRLAAPNLTEKAAHAINAVHQIKYVNLDLYVEIDEWVSIDPAGITQESRESFRSSMVSTINDAFPDREELTREWEDEVFSDLEEEDQAAEEAL